MPFYVLEKHPSLYNIYIYIYIVIHIHTHIIYIYIHMPLYIQYTYTFNYMYLFTYLQFLVCIYIYIHLHLHKYVCIIYIYLCARTPQKIQLWSHLRSRFSFRMCWICCPPCFASTWKWTRRCCWWTRKVYRVNSDRYIWIVVNSDNSWWLMVIYPLVNVNRLRTGKSPFVMGKSTNCSWAIFNSNANLPEGTRQKWRVVKNMWWKIMENIPWN